MTKPRFFVEEVNDKAIIKGEELHHLKDIHRLKINDEVILFNGTGIEYKGKIESISKKEVIVNIIEKINGKNLNKLKIFLYQGVPKLKKMDIIVEKGTELGVHSITPVLTKRIIYEKDFKKEESRILRWKKIAISACKQSGRATIPIIEKFIEFERIIEKLNKNRLNIILWEGEKETFIKDVLKNYKNPEEIGVIIGPEGGFTEDEIKYSKDYGVIPVSLGEIILRVETASLFVLSVIYYEYF